MSKIITGSSLILGSIIVIIFNFLLPGNLDAFSKNVVEVNTFTENYGDNHNLVQAYLTIIGLGLVIFLFGIIGIYKNVSNRDNNYKYFFLSTNALGVSLFLVSLAVATAFAGSADMNMKAYAMAQAAGQAASQAAQTGDQALMAQTAEQYNVASINSIIAGSSSAAIYTLFWGVFGIAGYIFYVSLISTGALILRSGNYYLSNLMNQITGYGFGIAGIVFLILNIIWKVNTEWGFRIFAISQIVWVILVIILAINFIRSDKK